MSALDGSVVNTILPVIRNYFHTDVANVEWAVVIYLLVVSILRLIPWPPRPGCSLLI